MASQTPSTRAIAKVFFVIAGLVGALYVLYLIREVVVIVVVAVFIAVALGPAVEFFHRRRVPRPLAILLVYVLILLTIFGVGLLIIPPVVNEVDDLSRDIPGYLDDVRESETFREYDEKYDITTKLNDQAAELPSRLGSAAGELRTVTVGIFATAVKTVAVLTIAFFLLLDARRILGFLFGLLGPSREERYRAVAGEVYRAVAGYVAGNLIISVMAGLMTYTTLTILDVPFAVPLAVLVAFLDLIPLVGATIGGIAVGIVTLFNDFPTATLVWAAVLLAYQQAENHLVQPLVYRKTVNEPPLLVIVSILIGASLLGVLGALLAIPVAATIQIVIRDWWNVRRERLSQAETAVSQTA